MLKAHNDGFVKRLLIGRLGGSLRRNFAGIHVQGDLTALANDERSTLYFANHVSSWDGTIANYISYTYLQQNSFIMALEQTMVPRTTRAGLFSVNPLDRFSATQTLRYSVRLLQEVPRCALWIFPQGTLLPFHKRPLDFQKGAAIIFSQVKEVRLVPVVFYYALIRHSRPEAFVSFGEPLNLAPNANLSRLTSQLEVCLVENLDRLSNDLTNYNIQSFKTLIYGKPSLRESLVRRNGLPSAPLKAWGRTLDGSREEYDRIDGGSTLLTGEPATRA
jgi:1-acyl-sn-glycerol-3-phosphate acyltransferase